MAEVERLRHAIAESWDGLPWYGDPESEILAGISAERAAARVLPGAHTIHELVVHMTAWLDEARSLLGGAPPNPRPGFDWPAPGSLTEEAWARLREDLGRAHREFSKFLDAFPEERLDERVGPPEDVAAGGGITIHTLLVGVAQHGAYHLGQIAMLARHGGD